MRGQIRSRRVSLTAATSVCAALVAGCADTYPNSPAPTSVSTAHHLVARSASLGTVGSDSTITYGRSLVSSPPPSGAFASFTREQALVSAAASVVGEASGSPDVALRLVSFDPMGGVAPPPGANDNLKVSGVLAWVVVYPNTQAVIRGPGMSQADGQALASKFSCEWIVVLDAANGRGIDDEQICSGVSPSN